jgi:hypothetical protein
VVELLGNQLTILRTKLVDLYIMSPRAICFNFSSISCVLDILQAVEIGGDYIGEVCIVAGCARYRETFYYLRESEDQIGALF